MSARWRPCSAIHAVIADRALTPKLAKEHGALQKTIKPYVEFLAVTKEIDQAKAMLGDPEMKAALAEEELKGLRGAEIGPAHRLEDILLLGGEDYSSLIMEIRAGTGGDEAAIFAGDLLRMYTQYAREHGWKVEEISFSPGEQGGYKEIIFSVTGDDAFQHLKFESGGHRVQRVPKTETQGRIHTSAATVAVMPEPDDVQVEIDEAADIDLRAHAEPGGSPAANTSIKPKTPVRILVQKKAPPTGWKVRVPGRAQPEQELRPGHARSCAQPGLRTHKQERLRQARARPAQEPR